MKWTSLREAPLSASEPRWCSVNAFNKGRRYAGPDCLYLLRLPLDINLPIMIGAVT